MKEYWCNADPEEPLRKKPWLHNTPSEDLSNNVVSVAAFDEPIVTSDERCEGDLDAELDESLMLFD